MPYCICNRYIQYRILHQRVAANELLFKMMIKDSDIYSYCCTIPETLCHALIECPNQPYYGKKQRNGSAILQANISNYQITKGCLESMMIYQRKHVTNMLIVCTQLIIHKNRKKGESVYLRGVLYLM